MLRGGLAMHRQGSNLLAFQPLPCAYSATHSSAVAGQRRACPLHIHSPYHLGHTTPHTYTGQEGGLLCGRSHGAVGEPSAPLPTYCATTPKHYRFLPLRLPRCPTARLPLLAFTNTCLKRLPPRLFCWDTHTHYLPAPITQHTTASVPLPVLSSW